MLVVSENPADKQVEEAIIAVAKNRIEITQVYHLPGDYLTKHKTTIEAIIEDSIDRTRSKILSFFISIKLFIIS